MTFKPIAVNLFDAKRGVGSESMPTLPPLVTLPPRKWVEINRSKPGALAPPPNAEYLTIRRQSLSRCASRVFNKKPQLL